MVSGKRLTDSGANVYMGLFPFDEITKPDFVKYTIPSGSEISTLSRGYLLTVDKPNFTRWHSDFMEATDCLITLYGSGEKHWFFFPPSAECGVLERQFVRASTFMECLERYGGKISYCRQCVGDTVYLPYGWLHCVITVKLYNGCASLLSVGMKIQEQRKNSVWNLMTSVIAIDGDRKERNMKQPVSGP